MIGDAGFQGFGRFLTGSSGEYYFRTLKPVRYPGRTPHTHVAVKTRGRDRWTMGEVTARFDIVMGFTPEA